MKPDPYSFAHLSPDTPRAQVQNYYRGRRAADKFEEMFPGKDRYERAAKLFHRELRRAAGVMKP